MSESRMRENLTYGLMRGQRVKPLAYSTFTGTPFQVLFRVYQMPYELDGKCVTVVVFTGLHFRAFYLLTFAASHDLKETIDKDYCECGMPLETVRESEAPLKERSERV